jgi:hypothetical protein
MAHAVESAEPFNGVGRLKDEYDADESELHRRSDPFSHASQDCVGIFTI